MGLGIDRLVIFLTKAANIRDTIFFPTLPNWPQSTQQAFGLRFPFRE